MIAFAEATPGDTLTTERLPKFIGQMRGLVLRGPAMLADAVGPSIDLGQAADGTPVVRAIPRIATPAYFAVHGIPRHHEYRQRPALEARGIGYCGNHGEPLYPKDPCEYVTALLSPPKSPRQHTRASAVPRSLAAAQGSIPTPERVVAFLTQKARLSEEEILATFRPGRRSAEQRATRELVEQAVVALFDRYVVAWHPAAGTRQFRTARSVWSTMTPGGLQRYFDIELAKASIYGELAYADTRALERMRTTRLAHPRPRRRRSGSTVDRRACPRSAAARSSS